jgi:hypothetical protein
MSFKNPISLPTYFFVIVLFSLLHGSRLPDQPPATKAIQEPVIVEARLLEQSDDSVVRVEFFIKMDKNIHIFSSEAHFFALKITESEGLDTPIVKLPPSKRYRSIDGTMADAYTGTEKIILTCRITTLPWKMRGYVQYQACDKNKCFFPSKKWFALSSKSAVGSVERLSDSLPETMPDSVDPR